MKHPATAGKPSKLELLKNAMTQTSKYSVMFVLFVVQKWKKMTMKLMVFLVDSPARRGRVATTETR